MQELKEMELGLERAALESALDVATPVNADSMQQVRVTTGHSAKTTLEFGRAGECQLYVERAEFVEKAKQVVHQSL